MKDHTAILVKKECFLSCSIIYKDSSDPPSRINTALLFRAVSALFAFSCFIDYVLVLDLRKEVYYLLVYLLKTSL